MSKINPPDDTRLLAILEMYGADASRWPEGDRAAMEKFLARSKNGQEQLEAAREIDRILDQEFTYENAPSHLHGAVMQDAKNIFHPEKWYKNLWQAPSLRPAGGLFAAIIIGIGLGWFSPNIVIIEQGLDLDEISLSDSVLEWEENNENS